MSEQIQTEDCLDCGATGLCYHCNKDGNGDGTITIKGHRVTCATCKGTALCPTCKGRGQLVRRIIRP